MQIGAFLSACECEPTLNRVACKGPKFLHIYKDLLHSHAKMGSWERRKVEGWGGGKNEREKRCQWVTMLVMEHWPSQNLLWQTQSLNLFKPPDQQIILTPISPTPKKCKKKTKPTNKQKISWLVVWPFGWLLKLAYRAVKDDKAILQKECCEGQTPFLIYNMTTSSIGNQADIHIFGPVNNNSNDSHQWIPTNKMLQLGLEVVSYLKTFVCIMHDWRM